MISIIVPVYNCAQYLPVCVESLLGQTCTDLEIVLVDDGSSDESGALCDSYARRDSRVVVIHTENLGASHARNVGLEAAKGEWVGFCDSDDAVDAGMYERLLCGLAETGADSALCGYRRCDAALNPQTDDLPDHPVLLTRSEAMKGVLSDAYYHEYQGYLWNRVFRRELIEKDHVRFDETIVFSEDKLFIFACLDRGGRVYYTPRPYYNYRANPAGLTKTDRYIEGGKDEVYVYHRLMSTLRNADDEVRRILTGWNLHNSIVRLWALLRTGRQEPELESFFFAEFRHCKLIGYPEYVKRKQRLFARLYRRFPGIVRRIAAARR